jgi:hypothetical protein
MAFVKMSTEAMKAVGSPNPGVITKAAAKAMSKSGDPVLMERNKMVSHKADPGKKAPIMAGKPRGVTPMASKKSKVTKQLRGSVDGGPNVHDPEGMF